MWVWISFHALSFVFHVVPDIFAVVAFGLPLRIYSPCLYRIVFSLDLTQKHRPKSEKIVHMNGIFDHALLQACPHFAVKWVRINFDSAADKSLS